MATRTRTFIIITIIIVIIIIIIIVIIIIIIIIMLIIEIIIMMLIVIPHLYCAISTAHYHYFIWRHIESNNSKNCLTPKSLIGRECKFL